MGAAEPPARARRAAPAATTGAGLARLRVGHPDPTDLPVDTVLLDLDGTLYEGSKPVPGAADAVGRLRAAGLTIRFTTNTDSVTAAALAARLIGIGMPAAERDFVTPVTVAAGLFAAIPGCRVLAVASEGVRAALGRVLAAPGQRPTHVLIADPSFGATYDDLDRAFRAVQAGAVLVATQLARTVRRDDGEHLDTGGWVRLLEYATGRAAQVLGKPSTEFFAVPLRALGRDPSTSLVVGDDHDSDLAGAAAVGAPAALVRTGKGRRPLPAGTARPTVILDSVADLPGVLGV
jgi:HAD superfamily hydrolase (TIGR01458 family)